MKVLEELLFKKIETWLVGLIVVSLLVLALLFGWLVHYASSGGARFPILGEIALAIVEAPSTVRDLRTGAAKLDDHEVQGDFEEPGGFTFFGEIANPQYVLVSRYDRSIRWSVVELYREGQTTPLWRWTFDDPNKLTFESPPPFAQPPEANRADLLRPKHPSILDNGHLVTHTNDGALFEVDACGDLVWLNSKHAYHHSLELDADGSMWVPAALSTNRIALGWGEDLKDDHAVKVNRTGEVIYKKSVIDILENAGLLNLIYDYDLYQADPIHLNDIQPVQVNGEVAKKGDIFLSLGHLNMVMLFRPSTDELVWYSQDRIMHQHDVDIMGPDQISVYDNRRRTGPGDKPIVLGTNEIVRYDLPGDAAVKIFETALQDMQIKTFNQGLSDYIPESGLMVEETSRGRLIKFDKNEQPSWVFVNRSEDGRLWTMNWSRYVPKSVGDAAVRALSGSRCDKR